MHAPTYTAHAYASVALRANSGWLAWRPLMEKSHSCLRSFRFTSPSSSSSSPSCLHCRRFRLRLHCLRHHSARQRSGHWSWSSRNRLYRFNVDMHTLTHIYTHIHIRTGADLNRKVHTHIKHSQSHTCTHAPHTHVYTCDVCIYICET